MKRGDRLGKGGMGDVFAGEVLFSSVAVKCLPPLDNQVRAGARRLVSAMISLEPAVVFLWMCSLMGSVALGVGCP